MALPNNPRTPSHKLNPRDAIQVWIHYAEGHFPHRIACHFDTDPARIYDVLKETLHKGSRAKATKELEQDNPVLAKKLRDFKFKSKKKTDENQADLFDK